MRRTEEKSDRFPQDADFGVLERNLDTILSPVKPRTEFIRRVSHEIGRKPDPSDILVEDVSGINWLFVLLGIVCGLFIVVMVAQALRQLAFSSRRIRYRQHKSSS